MLSTCVADYRPHQPGLCNSVDPCPVCGERVPVGHDHSPRACLAAWLRKGGVR